MAHHHLNFGGVCQYPLVLKAGVCLCSAALAPSEIPQWQLFFCIASVTHVVMLTNC